jgi:hypothetical protein
LSSEWLIIFTPGEKVPNCALYLLFQQDNRPTKKIKHQNNYRLTDKICPVITPDPDRNNLTRLNVFQIFLKKKEVGGQLRQ